MSAQQIGEAQTLAEQWLSANGGLSYIPNSRQTGTLKVPDRNSDKNSAPVVEAGSPDLARKYPEIADVLSDPLVASCSGGFYSELLRLYVTCWKCGG
jgi:hypothetical protein